MKISVEIKVEYENDDIAEPVSFKLNIPSEYDLIQKRSLLKILAKDIKNRLLEDHG